MGSFFVLLYMSIAILCLAGYTKGKAIVTRTVPIHWPALYPESLAWDDRLGFFISGSLARGALFSISDNGTVSEFIHDLDYAGISATIGLTIDHDRRRLLTVVNNVFEHPSSFNALASYNLDTKSRIFLAKFDPHACPNDVTVDPATGFAYVTDSAHDVIFKVSPAGQSSVFAKGPVFSSQPVVAVDPAAARSGLNGIVVFHGHLSGDHLLVSQSKSGKLFRVGLHDAEVRVVEMVEPLVAADGMRMRQDGILVVVSTDVLWMVKSKDHWKTAYVVEQVPLDRSLNSTSVALRGPKDTAWIIHAHFQDLFTVAEKGMEALPGGEFRTEFSFQEVKLPVDPDNNPLWLLAIVAIIVLMLGCYKLQLKYFLDRYNRSIKRD